MKKILIIILFPVCAIATERTCVNIEFIHNGEVISCSEARTYPDDKALQESALKFCGDTK